MVRKLKSHPLPLFFTLAYLFTWLIWGTSIAQARGLLSFHIPGSLTFWIGLNLATCLTAAFTGGWAAIRDIFSRILRWRVGFVWYLVALLLTALLALIAIGLYLALGGQHQVGGLVTLRQIPSSLLFGVFMWTLTEETAWRGFALPRLQKKYNALNASLILGLLWGFWHIPLFFIPGTFQSSSGLPLPGFVLLTVAQSLLFTWVYNHTHGSVLIAGIFHAAADVTIPYLNVMTGALQLSWLFIIVTVVAAGLVVAWQGSQNLAHDPDISGLTYEVTDTAVRI